MNLLLDTHLLIWAAKTPDQLSAAAVALIESGDHRLHFSAASVWEVAIKTSLGRPDFSVDADQLRRGLVRSGFSELEISGQHAQAVATLPPVHRDPFDRLLIAQARFEGMLLLTADRKVADYGNGIRLV